MIKRLIIGVITLLVVAALVFAGLYSWNKMKASKAPEGETEIALNDRALGEIPDTTQPEVELAPDLPSEEVPGPEVEAPELEVEAPSEIEIAAPEEPVDLSLPDIEPTIKVEVQEVPEAPSVSSPAAISTPPRETRPTTAQPAATRPGQPSELVVTEAVAGPASTPIPAAPVPAKPAPAKPAPTKPAISPAAALPAGDFSVHTLVPVLETQLSAVRKSMQSLGVRLQEQRIGQQQVQAHRIAVGFFRTKQEATTWAQANFRPKGVTYYVYPVQGMYSIQVGVYTQQPNVERAIRELYGKFPGWRLPVRTEMITITKAFYNLSIRNITESLARKVQDALVRLGIQAELARA